MKPDATRCTFLATLLLALASGDASAQRSTPVTIVDSILVEVSASPRAGVEPLDVFFSSSMQGGTGTLAYWWDFGDGSSGSAPSPVHQYTVPGSYRAILTVIDDEGHAALASIDVQVDADLVPAVQVLPETTSGIVPLTARFESTVATGNPPLSYSWRVDGVPQASTPTTLLDFATPSVYSVELVVTDADGDVSTDAVSVTAQDDQLVVIDATASTSGGTAPLHVGFVSSVLSGNPPFTFHWEFGEGSSSSLQNPAFLFSQPGDYAINLVVTDANGDSDSTVLFVLVTPAP